MTSGFSRLMMLSITERGEVKVNNKTSDESIERLIHDWRQSVSQYAKAAADKEYLYHFRKSKVAILMAEAAQNGVKAANAQEVYARAHPDYIAVLDGYRQAVEVYEQLRYRMKIAETRVDVWRTQQASNRRERQHYGA